MTWSRCGSHCHATDKVWSGRGVVRPAVDVGPERDDPHANPAPSTPSPHPRGSACPSHAQHMPGARPAHPLLPTRAHLLRPSQPRTAVLPSTLRCFFSTTLTSHRFALGPPQVMVRNQTPRVRLLGHCASLRGMKIPLPVICTLRL